MTSTTACRMALVTPSTEFWTYVLLSKASSRSTPGGRADRTSGSAARTARATSSAFAPPWRCTDSATPSRPSVRTPVSTSCGPTCASPTSRICSDQSGPARSTKELNSSGVATVVLASNGTRRPAVSISPEGTSAFCASSARETSATVTPRAASSSGSSPIRIA